MGWGSGGWGRNPWGGSTIDGIEEILPESVTVSEDLTVFVPFEVVSAVSLYTYLARVDFSGFVDPGHLPNFDPASYSIPGLTVYGVVLHPTLPKSVILFTSEQIAIVYTVTVALNTQGVGGDLMNPLANFADFNGWPIVPQFLAAAQSDVKIQVIFTVPMQEDAELIDPANYYLEHVSSAPVSGTVIPITSITVLDNKHVEIIVGTDLVPDDYYALTIDSSVRSSANQILSPDTDLFQWEKYQPSPIEIDFVRFSGEVTTGLLGQPDGQVFFSPALDVAMANSTIEIDEVHVCTRAYDSYAVPEIPDPPVLYTFPAPSASYTSHLLNEGAVLWAPAARLGLARLDVSDFQEDEYTPPTDGPADAQLVETIDITRASFLNDDRWRTFPGTGASLGVFRTADNLTPIGPGPTTNINLQP